MSTETALTTTLAASRFADADVRFGPESARVLWSWDNDERAALVAFLTDAGFTATDRVASIQVAL